MTKLSKISFILNNELKEIELNPSTVVLDYLRSLRLTGTKEGCKEGDCGACTILAGELHGGILNYKSLNSCLIPVQNINGKHIVTIEGLNLEGKKLNPIQMVFADEGASQCGFCTPGFIVSLTGHFLNEGELKHSNLIGSMDGNICRCTGHNSIIRAANKLIDSFSEVVNKNGSGYQFLIEKNIIPGYFFNIKDRLKEISCNGMKTKRKNNNPMYFVSGGTDLFVQKPDEMLNQEAEFLESNSQLRGIKIEQGKCKIGCLTTVTELLESDIFQNMFPQVSGFAELFGSTPIRNSATLGGNLNNASPIGDMTAFFLALNSIVSLSDGSNKREILLSKFYKSYKNTDRKPGEFMESLSFNIPEGNYFFSFEKVSKRTYLDIASVNTAILIYIKNGLIEDVNISAGGVAAVPLLLVATGEFLKGKILKPDSLRDAVSITQNEISPISDARGSAGYKRLLLSRLIYAHFIKLFPEVIKIEDTL